MKRLAIAVLVAAAILPHRARADATALAVELSRLAYPEDSYRKLKKTGIEQAERYMQSVLAQMGMRVPANLPARVAEEYERIVPSYQEMLDLQTGLLVKHYTEEELGQLIAFYRTAVGQKAIRIMPEVAAETSGELLAILQQRMPGMIERLKAEFRAKQPARSEAPAPAPAKR